MSRHSAHSKFALVAATALSACALRSEAAFARYFDLSIDGMYQRVDATYKRTIYQTLGVEVGIPLNQYLEVSVGHMVTVEREIFNDLYKDYLRDQGLTVPATELVATDDKADTYLNASFGFAMGYIRPSFFGGVLWRTACSEDTFRDNGCEKNKVAWNAGLAAQAYVTMNTRLKATFRVSPPITQKSKFKDLDQKLTVGLAWSI